MCSQQDEKKLVQIVRDSCKDNPHTPVLFVASLSRSGGGPKELEGSRVGGDVFLVGSTKTFAVC